MGRAYQIFLCRCLGITVFYATLAAMPACSSKSSGDQWWVVTKTG